MKIVYVMDPICGWCYGNINNTADMFDEFKDRVEFEVLPGGMWSGNNVRVQSEHMVNYFLKHDAVITDRTGVQFGTAYLDFIKNRNDVVLNSEIPSRAIVTVNKIAHNQIIPFTVEVLKARYLYGNDLNKDDTYAKILTELGIGQAVFFDLFKTDELSNATQSTFMKAARYARSYPTILAEKDGQAYVLEQGYVSYEELRNRISQLL